jgi:thymidylate synthase (FAD)
VEIKTSRAIAAQILRHRSFTFQEFSQRYAQAFDYVPYEARRQDSKNRQNSIDDMDDTTKNWFKHAQEETWERQQKLYDDALQRGIAKEQARFLLPLNTATTIYMTGSVRSWMTYFLVRMEKSTQLEHRQIASDCYGVFKAKLPDIAEALEGQYPEIFV